MSGEFTWGFAAGRDNPVGLHLVFRQEPDGHSAFFTPQKEHQGYAGIVHGGIIATLLDEAMGDYVYRLTGRMAVTAKLELRYRCAVAIQQQLKVVAVLLRCKGRVRETSGKLFLADGSLAVEARGKFFLL